MRACVHVCAALIVGFIIGSICFYDDINVELTSTQSKYLSECIQRPKANIYVCLQQAKEFK